MPVGPQDIQNKEFREAFRGYNEDEVDTFLDEVAEEFARLYQENQRMKVQLAALQQEVARLAEAKEVAASRTREDPKGPASQGVPEDMKRAIAATQKAAEAALEEAKRRAQEITQRAEQRAREIDELTARRAKDVDSDAAAALTDAQKRIADLKRQEVEIRRRIRTFLETQLSGLQALELDLASGGSSGGEGESQSGTGEGRSAVVERMARELAQDESAPAPQGVREAEQFWPG